MSAQGKFQHPNLKLYWFSQRQCKEHQKRGQFDLCSFVQLDPGLNLCLRLRKDGETGSVPVNVTIQAINRRWSHLSHYPSKRSYGHPEEWLWATQPDQFFAPMRLFAALPAIRGHYDRSPPPKSVRRLRIPASTVRLGFLWEVGVSAPGGAFDVHRSSQQQKKRGTRASLLLRSTPIQADSEIVASRPLSCSPALRTLRSYCAVPRPLYGKPLVSRGRRVRLRLTQTHLRHRRPRLWVPARSPAQVPPDPS